MDSGEIEFAFGYLIDDFPDHSDDFYEFHIITSGEGRLINKDKSVSLKAGRMFVSPPGEIHRVSVSKELIFTILRVSRPGTAASLLDELCYRSWCEEGIPIEMSHIYQLDRLKLLSGFNSSSDSAAWYGLLSLLYEIRSGQIRPPAGDERIQKAVRYMEMNITRKLTVIEIAAQLSMTSSGFSHLFKKIVGISPMDYFMTMKIDAAGYILEHNNRISNKELAARFAFSDEYHFSKTFSRKTGLSPRKFRKSGLSGEKSVTVR